MIDHAIFEDLQTKIDEEAAVRDVSRRAFRAKKWRLTLTRDGVLYLGAS